MFLSETKSLGFIFAQNVIETPDSHPELWEIPIISFGLVHALQKSVWQQVQLLLAQLSSVVQPFSPLSVEEKRKNQLPQTEHFLTAEVQKPQKNQNTSELSDDHTVTPAGPTDGLDQSEH